jgi:hypothetical protein
MDAFVEHPSIGDRRSDEHKEKVGLRTEPCVFNREGRKVVQVLSALERLLLLREPGIGPSPLDLTFDHFVVVGHTRSILCRICLRQRGADLLGGQNSGTHDKGRKQAACAVRNKAQSQLGLAKMVGIFEGRSGRSRHRIEEAAP